MAALADTAPGPVQGPGPEAAPEIDRRVAARPDGLGLLLAGLLGLIAARPISDNSFMTHLATGRVLLQDGFVNTNPFLYSVSDFPIPSWWWSGVLGLGDAVAGAPGIRVLTVAVAAALGAVIVRLTRPLHGERQGLLAVVVPSFFAFFALMPFLNARPHLPGFLLLGVALLIWRERRSGWWMVPVFATWVNVHGSWMYGLAVLALFAACEAVDERRVDLRRWAPLGAAVLGLLAGGALYPERMALLVLPFEQFGDDRARQALSAYHEWAPAGWDHPLTWCLVAMGMVGLFGVLKRGSLATAVGVLILVALGLSAGRLLPVAAISLVPWVAGGLEGIGTTPCPTGRGTVVANGIGAVCLAVALSWSFLGSGYDLTRYPTAAADWLDDRDLSARPDVRVASHDYAGNYLEWRYGAGVNTYVDDRAGTDRMLDYLALNDLTPGWPQALDRADPDVIVWRSEAPLTAELADDDTWVQAERLDGFTIFCRAPIADRCR